MKLITASFKKALTDYPLYSQEGKSDPVVHVKLFHPAGAGTWFVTEYDPENKMAFGFVTGFGGDEFGYISMDEMECADLPLGIQIERDIHFKPQLLSKCLLEAS